MSSSIDSHMRSIIFISILLLSLNINSQNKVKKDSLLKRLNFDESSKEKRIALLLDIGYYHPNIDSAMLFANQALQLAKKLNSPLLEAEAWEEISNKENRLGNNNRSFQAAFNALKIYESLEMFEKQAASYAQLANNYMIDKDYFQSIKNLKKAIAIYEVSDEFGNQIFTILNLGEMHRLAGHIDSAKVSFKKVLNMNKEIKNEVAESYSLGNLGMVYSTQDSLQLAKKHLRGAITILAELGDPYAISVYLAELGEVYQEERKPKSAEEKFLEALIMAEEAGLKEQIRDFSEKLTRFYESQGNYAEALKYQKQFQVYQDSLVNKTNIQEIERLKAGYEIDKRESQIGLLNTLNTKQKYLLWALGSGVFATLVFLYLIFKVNKRVKKANLRLTEQKVVIAQSEQEKTLLLRELNHRVKNNLQMISSLLNLQSRELDGHPAKEALLAGKDRVEALSLVHRKLYQEGAETRIALQEYVEELVLGLAHGYQADFEPDFEITDIDVSIDTAIPLALIINELVVNALKYAYTEVTKPNLTIKAQQIKNQLLLEVIDNGKGFSLQEGSLTNSFGLKLISSLVEQLQGTVKKKNGIGTHWVIQIPFVVKSAIPKTLEKPLSEETNDQRFRRRSRKGQKKKEVV